MDTSETGNRKALLGQLDMNSAKREENYYYRDFSLDTGSQKHLMSGCKTVDTRVTAQVK